MCSREDDTSMIDYKETSMLIPAPTELEINFYIWAADFLKFIVSKRKDKKLIISRKQFEAYVNSAENTSLYIKISETEATISVRPSNEDTIPGVVYTSI